MTSRSSSSDGQNTDGQNTDGHNSDGHNTDDQNAVAAKAEGNGGVIELHRNAISGRFEAINEGPGPIVPLLDTEGHPTFDELGRQRFFNRASGETLSGRPVDHGASSTRVMIVDHDDTEEKTLSGKDQTKKKTKTTSKKTKKTKKVSKK